MDEDECDGDNGDEGDAPGRAAAADFRAAILRGEKPARAGLEKLLELRACEREWE